MALTIRQRILKIIYPLLTLLGKATAKGKIRSNKQRLTPQIPFYSIPLQLTNGKALPLEMVKGKKILIVNTASNCGYTAQYAELQKLYLHAKEDLEIIGFPANDFKEQESGSDEEIAQFCSLNFGVSFPLAKKSSVVKSATQHPIFIWLSHKEKNGWNDQQPEWNFSKYLLNEEGILTHYFPPSVSPLSTEMLTAINQ
ncbi:MAG TPA: glutathione peroxidase [Flavisolibacter sp.]|jgi:glutathione peroxidase|nr:glutathione peroxidase [Flavisolibacter sp.]